MRKIQTLSDLLSKGTDTPNGCIVGKGKARKQVAYNGEMWYSYRLSFYLATGIHPGKFCVCHSCDNGKCFNPKHLFLGTQLENVKDCVAKERHAHGETTYSVLTEVQVRFMRKEQRRRPRRVKNWAAKYKVSKTTIQKALLGKTWKHLPGALSSLKCLGQRHFRAYLTEAQVREIKLRLLAKESKSSLAKLFGTTYWTINDISRGATWAHVEL